MFVYIYIYIFKKENKKNETRQYMICVFRCAHTFMFIYMQVLYILIYICAGWERKDNEKMDMYIGKM